MGIEKAYEIANNNYLNNGNNRIILATDGEFPINRKISKTVKQNSKIKIYLTIFHFTNSEKSSEKLKNLSKKGMGNYEIITPDNINSKLVNEVKAIKKKCGIIF